MLASRHRLAAIALFCLPALLRAADTIEVFGLKWTVPIAADWKVETIDGFSTLNLLVPRPSTEPRRPTQFALADTPDYITVTIDAEVKKEPKALRNRQTSLIFIYAYTDASHFNYAHLSDDIGAARAEGQHNGMFHVYGGNRVRMSSPEGPASLTEEKWYKVRLVYDGNTGKAEVFVDGKPNPSLRAVDLSFKAGKVGIGSFFDMGQFRNVKIQGKTR
jgi:hypothetical protein